MLFKRFYTKDTSSNWEDNEEYNRVFLKGAKQYANQELETKGYLTVYDFMQILGIKTDMENAAFESRYGWIFDDKKELWFKTNFLDDGGIELFMKVERLKERKDEWEPYLRDLQDATEEVAAYWGDKMPMMAMEECGELIQAISKYERLSSGNEALTDEIGDVFISCMALLNHYGIDCDTIDARIKKKLAKRYD